MQRTGFAGGGTGGEKTSGRGCAGQRRLRGRAWQSFRSEFGKSTPKREAFRKWNRRSSNERGEGCSRRFGEGKGKRGEERGENGWRKTQRRGDQGPPSTLFAGIGDVTEDYRVEEAPSPERASIIQISPQERVNEKEEAVYKEKHLGCTAESYQLMRSPQAWWNHGDTYVFPRWRVRLKKGKEETIAPSESSFREADLDQSSQRALDREGEELFSQRRREKGQEKKKKGRRGNCLLSSAFAGYHAKVESRREERQHSWAGVPTTRPIVNRTGPTWVACRRTRGEAGGALDHRRIATLSEGLSQRRDAPRPSGRSLRRNAVL